MLSDQNRSFTLLTSELPYAMFEVGRMNVFSRWEQKQKDWETFLTIILCVNSHNVLILCRFPCVFNMCYIVFHFDGFLF